MGNVMIDISSSNILMSLLLPAKAEYIARLLLGAVSINVLSVPFEILILSAMILELRFFINKYLKESCCSCPD